MNPRTWRWIGLTLVAIAAAGAMMPAKEPPRPAGKTTAQRAAEGPYVARTKTLSTTEDLSIVVVPSELGEPMDVKCFVYKNKEYGQVVFTCPNVSQIDMSLIDLEPQR